jgi:ABC-type multidrug transport system permease subunit
LPFLETLEAWSFRLFGRVAPSFSKHVVEFKDYLEKAKIRIFSETYVSLMFFISMLTFPVSIISVAFLYLYGFLPLIFLVPLPFYVVIGSNDWQKSS